MIQLSRLEHPYTLNVKKSDFFRDDYVASMTDLYFAKEQIDGFEPSDRWLTYHQLLGRWGYSMTPAEAEVLITSRYADGDLSVTHPLTGIPADEGEPTIEACLFRVTEIESVEAEIGQGAGAIPPGGTAGHIPAKTGTVKVVKECRVWLEELMRIGPPDGPKQQYRQDAVTRFPGLSLRSFGVAWKQAVENTQNIAWSRPGRKSKRRIDTPIQS